MLYRVLLPLIALLAISGVAVAADVTTNMDNDRAGDIVSLSGVMGISIQVKQQAEAAFFEVATDIYKESAENSAQKRRLFMSLSDWSQPALAERFQQVLNTYSDDEQRALLVLLQDPLMAQARHAEEVALSEQNTRAYQDYLTRLERYPPGRARAQRVNKLAKAIQMERWITKANEAVSKEGAVALERAVTGATFGDKTSEAVHYFLFYAYRRISNPEMDQLVRLWSEPLMQRWLNDAFKALPGEVSAATTDSEY
ncbi:hypothetical protein [Thalassolituus maritimus]|uniref:DUF2059 domain-containing protein n=1 Tax=Thalassolituus maritimus TaxID=484498 RepID=A0ABP9ZY67_9GAMM